MSQILSSCKGYEQLYEKHVWERSEITQKLTRKFIVGWQGIRLLRHWRRAIFSNARPSHRFPQTVILLLQTLQLNLFGHNLPFVVDQDTVDTCAIFKRAYLFVSFKKCNLSMRRALRTVLSRSPRNFENIPWFSFSHNFRNLEKLQSTVLSSTEIKRSEILPSRQ